MKQPITTEWVAEVSSAIRSIQSAKVSLAKVRRSTTPTFYRLTECQQTLEKLLKASKK